MISNTTPSLDNVAKELHEVAMLLKDKKSSSGKSTGGGIKGALPSFDAKKTEQYLKNYLKPQSPMMRVFAKMMNSAVGRFLVKTFSYVKFHTSSFFQSLIGIASGVFNKIFGRILQDIQPIIDTLRSTLRFTMDMLVKPALKLGLLLLTPRSDGSRVERAQLKEERKQTKLLQKLSGYVRQAGFGDLFSSGRARGSIIGGKIGAFIGSLFGKQKTTMVGRKTISHGGKEFVVDEGKEVPVAGKAQRALGFAGGVIGGIGKSIFGGVGAASNLLTAIPFIGGILSIIAKVALTAGIFGGVWNYLKQKFPNQTNWLETNVGNPLLSFLNDKVYPVVINILKSIGTSMIDMAIAIPKVILYRLTHFEFGFKKAVKWDEKDYRSFYFSDKGQKILEYEEKRRKGESTTPDEHNKYLKLKNKQQELWKNYQTSLKNLEEYSLGGPEGKKVMDKIQSSADKIVKNTSPSLSPASPTLEYSEGGFESFFQALGSHEGGSAGTKAIGPYIPGRGSAFGKWQIMPENWGAWIKEAGDAGIQFENYTKTAENVEKVARFKLGQYYRYYQNADAAAAAWYSGPIAGDLMTGKNLSGKNDNRIIDYERAMTRGPREGVPGPDVRGYIAKVRAAGETTSSIPNPYDAMRTGITKTTPGFTDAGVGGFFTKFLNDLMGASNDAYVAASNLSMNELSQITAADEAKRMDDIITAVTKTPPETKERRKRERKEKKGDVTVVVNNNGVGPRANVNGVPADPFAFGPLVWATKALGVG